MKVILGHSLCCDRACWCLFVLSWGAWSGHLSIASIIIAWLIHLCVRPSWRLRRPEVFISSLPFLIIIVISLVRRASISSRVMIRTSFSFCELRWWHTFRNPLGWTAMIHRRSSPFWRAWARTSTSSLVLPFWSRVFVIVRSLIVLLPIITISLKPIVNWSLIWPSVCLIVVSMMITMLRRMFSTMSVLLVSMMMSYRTPVRVIIKTTSWIVVSFRSRFFWAITSIFASPLIRIAIYWWLLHRNVPVTPRLRRHLGPPINLFCWPFLSILRSLDLFRHAFVPLFGLAFSHFCIDWLLAHVLVTTSAVPRVSILVFTISLVVISAKRSLCVWRSQIRLWLSKAITFLLWRYRPLGHVPISSFSIAAFRLSSLRLLFIQVSFPTCAIWLLLIVAPRLVATVMVTALVRRCLLLSILVVVCPLEGRDWLLIWINWFAVMGVGWWPAWLIGMVLRGAVRLMAVLVAIAIGGAWLGRDGAWWG